MTAQPVARHNHSDRTTPPAAPRRARRGEQVYGYPQDGRGALRAMSDGGDLAAWLLERIAEDEAAARAAITHPAPEDADAVYVAWSRYDTGWVPAASGEWTEGTALFARWDPARIIAECEAKRKLLAWHRQYDTDEFGHPHGREDQCPAWRLLALPYAAHPDYRAEWRVE